MLTAPVVEDRHPTFPISLLLLSSLQFLEGSCWYPDHGPCLQLQAACYSFLGVCFPPPLQMWRISKFTKKRVGEKIRELNDLSPPEHTPTLTHTDTEREGNHSTPPSVYIRNVLHTQMTVLCRIFSSEVMVEAVHSQKAEF